MIGEISVKSLEDYQVLDVSGATLGHVDDVMLDGTLGRARYFVLSISGGLLGGHKARYAVPARSIRLDSENEALVVDLAPERLENAKPFDERDDADVDAVYRL